MQIVINTGEANTFLLTDRCFLRFTITLVPTFTNNTGIACTSTNGTSADALQVPIACIEGGAWNAFRQMRVLYGSKVLEDVYFYNDIFNMMFLNNVFQNDMQTSKSFCSCNNNYANTSSYFYDGKPFQLTQTTT